MVPLRPNQHLDNCVAASCERPASNEALIALQPHQAPRLTIPDIHAIMEALLVRFGLFQSVPGDKDSRKTGTKSGTSAIFE